MLLAYQPFANRICVATVEFSYGREILSSASAAPAVREVALSHAGHRESRRGVSFESASAVAFAIRSLRTLSSLTVRTVDEVFAWSGRSSFMGEI
jgi:hypothetical protein